MLPQCWPVIRDTFMVHNFLFLHDIFFVKKTKITLGVKINMRNGNNFWPFLAICGAVTAAFIWFRNGQNNLPQWAQQPMNQMGKTAQQIAGAFNPQG